MKDDLARTTISISIFGESAVGKTCICLAFLGTDLPDTHIATIGIDKKISLIKTEEGDVLKLKLWDTAGQERFKSVSIRNLRFSQAAIVVFDLTEKESFKRVIFWLKQIRDYSDIMPIVLFGNKSDLVEKRVVSRQEIDEFCKKENIIYFETSAKNKTGINEGFTKVASMAYKIYGNVESTGLKLKKIKKKKSKC